MIQKCLKFHQFRLDKENLNVLLDDPPEIKVMSILSFSKNNAIEGFATYYISNSKMYLKTDLPKMKDLMQVNGVILEDILFIQEKNCEGCDVTILKSELKTSENDIMWSNSYSDMSLCRFREQFFELKSSGEYRLFDPYESHLI